VVRYPIHDLVDVVLDRDLDPLLRRSIEFQVSGFGPIESGPRTEVPAVVVRPYREFKAAQGGAVFTFNDMFSDRSTFLDEPSRRTATVRDDTGFRIFADGHVPILLYIQLLLAEQDLTLVHAAGLVDEDGRALLVAGGGGAGKTALLGHLVRSGGWRLLGDDLVCLSADGWCYSFLRHLVLKSYHRTVFPSAFRQGSLRRAALIRATDLVRANAPFVGVTKSVLARLGLRERVTRRIPSGPPDQEAVPIADVFGPDRVAARAELERVIFLDRYEGAGPLWRPMVPAQLARLLFSIVHHEISTSLRSLLALGAVDLVDVPGYFLRAARIGERAVEGRVSERLSVPRAATPQELADAVTNRLRRGTTA
jgi:hypothetical protein